LDESNFFFSDCAKNYKGDFIPQIRFPSSTLQNEKDKTVSEPSYFGGLLVFSQAISILSTNSISTLQHLDSIVVCLETMFRIIVDENSSAVIFQDIKPDKTQSNDIFQYIVADLSKRILKLTEDAPDDLDITKMDYINLLYNSIVENLEYLETSKTDFKLIVSNCNDNKNDSNQPVLIYGHLEDVEKESSMNDSNDEEEDVEDENKRSQWGPLIITIGPQLCDKQSFLDSLQEDCYYKSIDEMPGVYESVYISLALEVWKKETALSKAKLSQMKGVLAYLKSRTLYKVSVFDRLVTVCFSLTIYAYLCLYL
jgi:hypothetical protein